MGGVGRLQQQKEAEHESKTKTCRTVSLQHCQPTRVVTTRTHRRTKKTKYGWPTPETHKTTNDMVPGLGARSFVIHRLCMRAQTQAIIDSTSTLRADRPTPSNAVPTLH